MSTLTMTLVFSDGKRVDVRNAANVPREGDHAFALGKYYVVQEVVWNFGMAPHNGDRSVAAMPVEIHLQPASAPKAPR